MIITGYHITQAVRTGTPVEIHRARRLSDNVNVVIRTVRLSNSEYADKQRRYHELCSGTRFSYTANVLDLLAIGDNLHLVLEDVGTTTLDSILSGVPLALEVRSTILRNLFVALDELHGNGIVHADLHPGNIVVDTNDYTVKLIDLGLGHRRTVVASSGEHGLRGDVRYISPEQTGRTSRGIDTRSDLYVAGIIAFQLYTGHLPFSGADTLSVVHAHLTAQPHAVVDIVPGSPRYLSNIIATLLAKQPEDRYQTAYGVLADLSAGAFLHPTEDLQLRSQDIRDWYDRPSLHVTRARFGDWVGQVVDSVGSKVVIAVRGVAGSGKSSLTTDIIAELRRRAVPVFQGGFEHTADIPLSAFDSVVRDISSWILKQDDEQLAQWRIRIGDSLGPNRSLAQSVIPAFSELFGVDTGQSPTSGSGREAQLRLATAMREFFDAVASALPHVIVLEDLHWADPASFDVLAALVRSTSGLGRTIVLTVRVDDPMVSAEQQARIAALFADAPNALDVSVGAMTPSDMDTMIRHTFQRVTPSIDELVDYVGAVTNGLPLGIEQFVSLLVERGSLYFDRTSRSWIFDRAAHSDMSTIGGSEFIVRQRLAGFPKEVSHVLAVHAVLGSSIRTSDLLLVVGKEYDVLSGVNQGYAIGILRKTAFEDEDGSRFVHDNVRRLTASLLSHAERVHSLRVFSQILVSRCAASRGNTSALFTAADLILHITPDDSTSDDTLVYIPLLIDAASAARLSGALDASVAFIRHAVDLADKHGVTDAGLRYELHRSLGDGLGTIGHFQDAETHLSMARGFAASNLERARVDAVLLHNLDMESRYEEAVVVARRGLGELGITIPTAPSMASMIARIGRAWYLQRNLNFASVRNSKHTHDEVYDVQIDLLKKLQAPAFSSDVKLFTVVQMMRASLVFQRGHNDASIDSYAIFGMIMRSVKSYGLAKRYADLSVEIADSSNDLSARAASLFIPGCTTTFWVHTVERCLDQLDNSAHLAELAGDQAQVAYSCGVYVKTLLFSGADPQYIADEIERSVERLVRTYRHHNDVPRLASYYHAVLAQHLVRLFPSTILHRLTQDVFARADELVDESLHSSDKAAVCFIMQLRATEALVRNDIDEVGRCLDLMKYSEQGMLVLTSEVEYTVLRAIYSVLRSRTEKKSTSHQRTVKKCLSTLVGWEQRVPETFRCRRMLVEGFSRLMDGSSTEALDLIDQSIAEARSQHNVVFAHFATLLRTIADGTFVREPTATIIPLVQRRSSSEASSVSHFDLDVASVLKASAVITAEIDQDMVIRRLLEILLQNAGADSAALVLLEKGLPFVRATYSGDVGKVELIHEELHRSSQLCVSVAQLAIRRGSYVLNEDVRRTELIRDPFIAANGTISLLVYPILYRSKIIGAIHLSNKSVTGAFLERHLGFLDLLVGHIAGALENARLYTELRQTLQATERFVPREFLEALGIASIRDAREGAAVNVRMTVLFADIRRFTSISERLSVRDTFAFLNHYLSAVAPCIARNGGFIDKYIGDAVMALFPGEPIHALKAGQEILAAVSALNKERGDGADPLEIGIGIHTGEIMLGTVGSADRIDTTAIGDTVNVAARLETLTKERGVPMLVSSDVAIACDKSDIAFRSAGTVELRGRTKQILVYEVD